MPEVAEEDEYFDVEIIEADDEGRALASDIPRDSSASDEPFFKLPLPEVEEDDYFDVEVIEAADEGRDLSSAGTKCSVRPNPLMKCATEFGVFKRFHFSVRVCIRFADSVVH